MPLTRRDTLGLAASTLAATLLPSVSSAEEAKKDAKKDAKIELVLFDAFPVFDPRPILESLETMAPGRGEKLGELWRNRQFAYTWLRTVAGEYEDFWKVTRDGLLYAAEAMDVVLSPRQVERIMNGYLTLKAWPDAPAALETLKAEGLRLAFLSNFTPRMLGAAIESAGLEGTFEQALSTDAVRTYKPDPRAYRLAIETLSMPRDRILFVPFAGWDAAGAKWFGYETFWVNRLGAPPEVLSVKADGMGSNLDDLVAYLRLRA
ncbi:MAG: haloacid dehalogenase type II [Methyloceanibacter sp.]|uniref:haloacid dehalogenase type II n=1 Tax=Methyloceanibacter sp. TaxID=1965321 RepID=UPI003EE1CF93